VNDLWNIINYMKAPQIPVAKYRQICDLQGFFLRTGGFLLADVPETREGLGKMKGAGYRTIPVDLLDLPHNKFSGL